MEETPLPRREGDDVAPSDPRFGPANDLNTDERLVVESGYPAIPAALAGHPNGSVSASLGQRSSDRVADAVSSLLSWVQREPAVALGTALALGFVVGFVLRRSVLLSEWELREVKRA